MEHGENCSAAHLKGIQVVDREYQGQRLLVIHNFDKTGMISYNLNKDDPKLLKCFGCDTAAVQIRGKELEITNMDCIFRILC